MLQLLFYMNVSSFASIFMAEQVLAQQPNSRVFLERTQVEQTCLMHRSATPVTQGSIVQVERQHLEVTVHPVITVQAALEWLNSFHAPMALIIQNLEGQVKTSV